MKKIILIALLGLTTLAGSAQVLTSRSLMKKQSQTTWYARLGLSIDMLSGLDSEDKDHGYSLGSKAGMAVDFGFNKPIGKSGVYWGMELGVQTRGGKINRYIERYDETSSATLTSWDVQYLPINFGYKYSITDDVKLDIHLGGFLSCDFTHKAKDDDGDELDTDVFDNRFDAGVQVGLGIWYKKVNLDFAYQHGFIEYTTSEYSSINTAAFMIRLGYAF